MASTLTIATWNINNVVTRLDLLLRWLEERRPDVVALQETKATDAAFPRQALESAGYASLAVGERSWNGVALLARGREIVEVRRTLPGDAKDKQARYVEAAIDGVLFANLYAVNGNPFPGPKYTAKLAWMERLIAHAQSLTDAGIPVVLLGDFNVIPTALDMYESRSYDDNALLQPAVRKAHGRLLAQGWVDAVRALHPDEPMHSFWGYLRNRWARDAGLRIDHVLLSKPLAPRLAAAFVDREVRGWEGASDHAPVVVELAASKRARGRR